MRVVCLASSAPTTNYSTNIQFSPIAIFPLFHATRWPNRPLLPPEYRCPLCLLPQLSVRHGNRYKLAASTPTVHAEELNRIKRRGCLVMYRFLWLWVVSTACCAALGMTTLVFGDQYDVTTNQNAIYEAATIPTPEFQTEVTQ